MDSPRITTHPDWTLRCEFPLEGNKLTSAEQRSLKAKVESDVVRDRNKSKRCVRCRSKLGPPSYALTNAYCVLCYMEMEVDPQVWGV